jgi:hypothetical protein
MCMDDASECGLWIFYCRVVILLQASLSQLIIEFPFLVLCEGANFSNSLDSSRQCIETCSFLLWVIVIVVGR